MVVITNHMKFKNCLKCKKKVSKNCHLGYCNKCRDRSGKNNPFYGRKHNKVMIERTKKKLSLISRKNWENLDYRAKVIQGTSKPRRIEFKDEQSQRVKEWYRSNPNQRNIRSRIMKQSWHDGKIEPNINSINESKLEKELLQELKVRLPGRNVRKKTLRIGTKWFYPDIKIDENVFIEFYGNYWHANPKIFKSKDIIHHKLSAEQIWKNDKERINTLEKNGFKVLIVWQDEYMKNKEKVINRLIRIV